MTYFTGRETMREMREIVEMIDMEDDNDTSDDAFIEWYKRYSHDENVSPLHIQAWREAIRRCEARMEIAMLEKEKAEIEFLKLSQLEWVEAERRKAFEAGFFYYQENVDYTEPDAERVANGYRAFKEAQK